MANNNTRLRIKLKSGEVKTFPWYAVTFYIRDGHCSVYETAECGLLLFRAPLENVEYIERINDGE